ncbi:tetratricopeptide repeat protein [Rubinisphaera margarita]|uniref:tetratricopeptide repeat protein n=1 Tax=Rubinisphaera margarita TaxID=2909586 RepID=UPI001EE8FA48|nr:hypothetical protein [Rubinisphaera margarita]MCG6155880.1 hypothetical protein [Rubinisphaera margarita]
MGVHAALLTALTWGAACSNSELDQLPTVSHVTEEVAANPDTQAEEFISSDSSSGPESSTTPPPVDQSNPIEPEFVSPPEGSSRDAEVAGDSTEPGPPRTEESSSESRQPDATAMAVPGASVQTNILLSGVPEMVSDAGMESPASSSTPQRVVKAASVSTEEVASLEAIERLHRDLEAESEPEAALSRLDSFLAFYRLSAAQEQQFAAERQTWAARGLEKLIRIDEHFVPRSELEEDQLVLIRYLASVIQLCQSRQSIESVLETLEKASRENSDSIVAFYHSGLIKAVWLNDSRDALGDFRRITREMPEHAGAWNNQAICEMKSGDFSRALGSWRKAVTSSQNLSDRTFIAHNIAYAAEIAQSEKIKAPASFSDAALRLLADAGPLVSGQPRARGPYWRFSPWIAKAEHVTAVRGYHDANAIPPQHIRPLKRISALAVGGEWLLVSTDDLSIPYLGMSDYIRVLSPDLQVMSSIGVAEFIATNEELGLTLLRCQALAAPVLEVARDIVEPGAPIHVGLSVPDQSMTFHSTNSVSLPTNVAYAFGLKMDEIEPLPTGAPVFDANGKLGGLIAPLSSSATGSPIQFVWSASTITEFLTAAGVVIPVTAEQGNGTWETRQHFLTNHLVRLELCYPEECLSLDLAQRSKFNASHYLTDRSCLVCDGRSRVNCDRKGCVKGQTSRRYKGIVSYTQKGEPIYGLKVAVERCTRCDGHATLDCPNCRDGTEPERGSLLLE